MSTEFTREDRYIVFKLSDVERYLTDADRTYLAMMKNEIDAGRDCANKPPFKGLIVESDWPEYEPTWKAIEARVTGAQPAAMEPTMQDALMKFDPATGEERPYPSHATQWRNWHGIAAWLFDPWTGKRRNAYDVGSDVYGLLIVPTGTLGMDMGGGCAEKNNVAAATEAKP